MLDNLGVGASTGSAPPSGPRSGSAHRCTAHRRRPPQAPGSAAGSSPGEEAVGDSRPLVTVIDDDQSVRESLPDLLRAFGYSARTFACAEDFLASDCLARTRCVLLDIAMPGMSGLELQVTLAQRLPIVFITAHADDATRSHAIDAGAVDCLLKPFTEDSLLEALTTAIEGHP
jgi:CheY-like chemotaxis protein